MLESTKFFHEVRRGLNMEAEGATEKEVLAHLEKVYNEHQKMRRNLIVLKRRIDD